MRGELSVNSPDVWEKNYQIRNYSFFPWCNRALEIPGFIIINNPGIHIFLKITQIFSSHNVWVFRTLHFKLFVREKRLKIAKWNYPSFQENTRIGFEKISVCLLLRFQELKVPAGRGLEERNYHVKTFVLIDKDNSLIVCHR